MSKKKNYVLYIFDGLMKWNVSDSFEDVRVAWIVFNHETTHYDFKNFSWKLVEKTTGRILRFYQGKNKKYKQPLPSKEDYYSDVYWMNRHKYAKAEVQ